MMRIKSRVRNGETWTLELTEDSPHAKLARARARVDDEDGLKAAVEDFKANGVW